MDYKELMRMLLNTDDPVIKEQIKSMLSQQAGTQNTSIPTGDPLLGAAMMVGNMVGDATTNMLSDNSSVRTSEEFKKKFMKNEMAKSVGNSIKPLGFIDNFKNAFSAKDRFKNGLKDLQQNSLSEYKDQLQSFEDGGIVGEPDRKQRKKFKKILKENKDLEWVQRLNDENAPFIENEDGTKSSHLMRAEKDSKGNWYVFPDIVMGNDGKLINLSKYIDSYYSFDKALIDKYAIKMDSKEDALAFADNGYKYVSKAFKDEIKNMKGQTGVIDGEPNDGTQMKANDGDVILNKEQIKKLGSKIRNKLTKNKITSETQDGSEDINVSDGELKIAKKDLDNNPDLKKEAYKALGKKVTMEPSIEGFEDLYAESENTEEKESWIKKFSNKVKDSDMSLEDILYGGQALAGIVGMFDDKDFEEAEIDPELRARLQKMKALEQTGLTEAEKIKMMSEVDAQTGNLLNNNQDFNRSLMALKGNTDAKLNILAESNRIKREKEGQTTGMVSELANRKDAARQERNARILAEMDASGNLFQSGIDNYFGKKRYDQFLKSIN